MGNHNVELGRRGEDYAAAYLQRHGVQVLARNWRCSIGELDLVCRDQRGVFAVEVKTRSSRRYGDGFEAVNAAKFQRLQRLLLCWAKSEECWVNTLRIDVIEVYWGNGKPSLHHHREVTQ
ncbi:YraN family protein [Glutamicibacter sp. PS]|uniref:YraN family protein n=1 Tax=Glutamicibacter sp. PS TaxID=3075634 RepID=UPI0028471DAB|nr:YraN family protein [Glutamicibacter sp. PS]MDR4532917.1 YraN family protein [Glutamicibacter sp. PS]